MPPVALAEKREAAGYISTYSKKQRISEPAITIEVARRRIKRGHYGEVTPNNDRVKEACNDLGLSKSQQKDLRRKLGDPMLVCTLDIHFATVDGADSISHMTDDYQVDPTPIRGWPRSLSFLISGADAADRNAAKRALVQRHERRMLSWTEGTADVQARQAAAVERNLHAELCGEAGYGAPHCGCFFCSKADWWVPAFAPDRDGCVHCSFWCEDEEVGEEEMDEEMEEGIIVGEMAGDTLNKGFILDFGGWGDFCLAIQRTMEVEMRCRSALLTSNQLPSSCGYVCMKGACMLREHSLDFYHLSLEEASVVLQPSFIAEQNSKLGIAGMLATKRFG